jgi:hypothetical protein
LSKLTNPDDAMGVERERVVGNGIGIGIGIATE